MSSLLGVGLALLAGAFKSSKSITTKFAASSVNSYTTSASMRLVAGVIFFIVVAGLDRFYIPTVKSFYIALLVNSVLYAVVALLYTEALRRSDISLITPLMALIPVTTVIPSFLLLGEIPSVIGLVGLILVSLGAYLLNFSSNQTSYFKPFKKLYSDSGVRLTFLGLILASVVPPIDKIGIEATNPLFWVMSQQLGAFTVIFIISVYLSKLVGFDTIKANWKVLLLVGVSSGMIGLLQSVGYTYTKVVYVQAIKRVSIVFSVIAGYYLFNEKNVRDRLGGAILILIGIICITLTV